MESCGERTLIEAPADSPVAARTRAARSLLAPLRWSRVGIRVILQFLLIGWAALAIYYSNLPWRWMRIDLAVAFALFAIWSLWISRRRRMRWAFTGAFAAVLVWFACIRPTHDRPWRGDVAVMSRAFIDGDHVRITNVRD